MTAAAAAIRTAGPGDAAAIAALHARSWRAAYRGILPDTYLDGPLLADRTVYWQAALALSDPGLVVLVLEGTPGMAGFAAARIPDPDGYGACIDNLHLAPELRGQGQGRTLLGALAGRLAGMGVSDACLWLFDGNHTAGRFYARLGGITGDGGFDEFAGGRFPHRRIVFPSLATLAERCAAE
ncbi:ribosomal protein S18 acetylase RimI-like enzyme [Stella humosa]|uniref:Ribosomal protein S18 acetylase RimI-like enzyme n=1 Tax=Stella humosa TaxID=94 RepID=A0A3N1LIC6_9PROT|nr:GNAT family N-acetyltransferase [Stella humosa]ROP91102.1 ribosomal protein S18 acetylase RimI-like enzyme [Stella humosa]BBK34547.1 hypothetical protein STHU_51810 [Stella humosa]